MVDNTGRPDYLDIQIAAMQNPNDLCLQFLRGVLLLDLKKVKQCLDQGINTNILFVDESTALHIAADNECIELAHLLLSYPETNPNMQDVAGSTPLNIAARNGNKDIAQLLIQYNADVDKSDHFQCSPLHTAILNSNESIVDILLDNGANSNTVDAFGRSPLYLAAKEITELHYVKKLLAHQADPNFYNIAFTMPLLMECCLSCNSEDHVRIIVTLIEAGAKVNEIYPITRRTPLHIAAFNGNLNLIKALLRYGAKTDVKDIRNMIPYQIAKEQHNKEAAKYLKPKVIFKKRN